MPATRHRRTRAGLTATIAAAAVAMSAVPALATTVVRSAFAAGVHVGPAASAATFTPQGTLPTAGTAGTDSADTVTYTGVWTSTDARVTAVESGAKVVLTLADDSAPNNYAWTVSSAVPDSTAVVNLDGSVDVTDPYGTVSGHVDAPKVNTNYGNDVPATWSVSGDRLTLTADHSDSAWTYPITAELRFTSPQDSETSTSLSTTCGSTVITNGDVDDIVADFAAKGLTLDDDEEAALREDPCSVKDVRIENPTATFAWGNATNTDIAVVPGDGTPTVVTAAAAPAVKAAAAKLTGSSSPADRTAVAAATQTPYTVAGRLNFDWPIYGQEDLNLVGGPFNRSRTVLPKDRALASVAMGLEFKLKVNAAGRYDGNVYDVKVLSLKRFESRVFKDLGITGAFTWEKEPTITNGEGKGIYTYTTSGAVSPTSGTTWRAEVRAALKVKFSGKAGFGPVTVDVAADFTLDNFEGSVVLYGTPQGSGDRGFYLASFNPQVRLTGSGNGLTLTRIK